MTNHGKVNAQILEPENQQIFVFLLRNNKLIGNQTLDNFFSLHWLTACCRVSTWSLNFITAAVQMYYYTPPKRNCKMGGVLGILQCTKMCIYILTIVTLLFIVRATLIVAEWCQGQKCFLTVLFIIVYKIVPFASLASTSPVTLYKMPVPNQNKIHGLKVHL